MRFLIFHPLENEFVQLWILQVELSVVRCHFKSNELEKNSFLYFKQHKMLLSRSCRDDSAINKRMIRQVEKVDELEMNMKARGLSSPNGDFQFEANTCLIPDFAFFSSAGIRVNFILPFLSTVLTTYPESRLIQVESRHFFLYQSNVPPPPTYYSRNTLGIVSLSLLLIQEQITKEKQLHWGERASIERYKNVSAQRMLMIEYTGLLKPLIGLVVQYYV